jgi:hypothetical protein
MSRLRRLNTGTVASNPTRGMDVCMPLFCVCAVLCVGSGLVTGWSPVQGVLPTVNHSLTHSLTHGTEPFLRSCQLCSYSRTSQHFMESEGSYRVNKSPPLVPILSQIDPIHTIASYLSKIHFNTVHPPTSCSSQWSLTFWLLSQYPICIPILPYSCYMPCPSHPPWLDHSNYID